jgi:ribosomal protein S27E
MKNPNPECVEEDCTFSHSGGTSTLVAYIPVYDKNGVNINPDSNTTTFKVNCLSCGKMWVGKSRLDVTTYEEVVGDT